MPKMPAGGGPSPIKVGTRRWSGGYEYTWNGSKWVATVGQTHTFNGTNYTWNGSKWVAASGTSTSTSSSGGGTSGGSSGGGSSGGSSAVGPILTTANGQKLTQAQYDALHASFKHLELVYGVPVADSAIHFDIAQGLTATEFGQRLAANQYLSQNPGLFKQFSDVAQWRNLTNKPLTFAQKLNTILHLGDAAFYNLWDEFIARAGAIKAGITPANTFVQGRTNPDLSLNRQEFQQFGKNLGAGAGVMLNPDTVTKATQQYAAWALAYEPASRYKGYGLSKEHLIAASTGQADANTMALITRMQAESTAFNQARANPTLQATAAGPQTSTPGLAGAPSQ